MSDLPIWTIRFHSVTTVGLSRCWFLLQRYSGWFVNPKSDNVAPRGDDLTLDGHVLVPGLPVLDLLATVVLAW